MPRIPSISKRNSHCSYKPKCNLPGMTKNFKDFADSYPNHHDFPSGAEGSNLVWWAPCFLAKKKTKLPTRQVTWRKAPFQMFFRREDTSQLRKHHFPSEKLVESWYTENLGWLLPAPVWAADPNYSHFRGSWHVRERRLTWLSLRALCVQPREQGTKRRDTEGEILRVEIWKPTYNACRHFHF